MAIVRVSYTRKRGRAKASVRYIENRPGRDGARLRRTLFKADGQVERREVYTMIDQAAQGSFFYRLVVSPDPRREDSDKNLGLRELTEKTIRSLEARFQQPLHWAATVHDDHAEHRHIHALAILPQRLNVQDCQYLRRAATEAALQQVQQLTLAREQQEQLQEDWSW
jgi:hypothetical protein